MCSNILIQLARAFCGLIRFGELRVASFVFKNCHKPWLIRRYLFGSKFVGDVSRSSFHQLLFLQGERSIPERHLVRGLLRPGMRVVDVGANIGYYVSMYQQVIGSTGRITCIEPSPENLAELHLNVSENAWRNVIIHECAVGRYAGIVGLRSGVNSGVVSIDEGVFQASMCRLDELIVEQCDFLKIDVDGYEWHVLEGAKNVIERDRPVLFLEYHSELVGRHGGSIEEVMGFLRCYYSDITYFDSMVDQSLLCKVSQRYLGQSAVRRINIDGILEADLHVGRLFGTFWILCRPVAGLENTTVQT